MTADLIYKCAAVAVVGLFAVQSAAALAAGRNQQSAVAALFAAANAAIFLWPK